MNSPLKNDLKSLLSLVADRPSTRIVHFSDGKKEFNDSLVEFATDKQYDYQLNATTPEFYERMKNEYNASTSVHLINFSLGRPKYFIQGKEYDYVFVTSHISTEEREDFLSKCYPIIKTAGNIILVIPQKEQEAQKNWLPLLEKKGYVASNILDDWIEGYDILISKRMHGWGES
jgi:hypothetical protein